MYLLQSRLLDEATKTLVKDGVLSETLELTDKGARILLTLVFSDYKDEMVKVAKNQLADRDNEKVAKVEIVNAPQGK